MKKLKTQLIALSLLYRRPDVAWYKKILPVLVLAYALSPIDLIPDFIPVLGYLDDLVLLPMGIYLIIKSISSDLWQECMLMAQESELKPSKFGWLGVGLVILFYGFFIYLIYTLVT
jgi:uncharacterized membrane protein YkvA (DUF1232 family)